MTNEQTALLLRGYQFRIRTIRAIAARDDAKTVHRPLADFDAELTKHIQELLGIAADGQTRRVQE